MNIKKISKLYDLLYDRADKLFKEYNPCNIKPIDGVFTCKGYDKERIIHCKHNMFCCMGCGEYKKNQFIPTAKHWNNGCTVKCLLCKLYICYRVSCYDKQYKLFFKKLNNLRNLWNKIKHRYKLPHDDYFMSKQCYIKKIKERIKRDKQHRTSKCVSV